MKINKLYISAFGGLKDYTLDLSGDMNVIFGENENGKSTVMAFIKAMFYGTGKNAQALSDNMRKRYTPWSGDAMGGRVYFEHNKTRYMLERQFRKSNATDRVILTNLDTDDESVVESDIGKRFFGMSDSAFERSNFIGICALASNDEATGELNSRLSNLVLTGDEDISYQTVLKRLDTAKNKVISKTGKAGIYARLSEELSALQEKYSSVKQSLVRKQELESKIQTLRTTYRSLKSQYEDTKQIVDSEDAIRSAAKLKEYLDTKASLDELNKSLLLADGKIADDMFIRSVTLYINSYEQKASVCARLQEEINKEEQALALACERDSAEIKRDLDSYIEKQKVCEQQIAETQSKVRNIESELATVKAQYEVAKTAKKKINPLFFCVGAILCGLSLCFTQLLPVLLTLLVLGVLSIVSGFIFRTTDKSAAQKLENKINELSEQYSLKVSGAESLLSQQKVINEYIATLTAAFNTDSALKEQKKKDIEEKKCLLSDAKKAELTALNEVFSVYGRYSQETDIDSVKFALSKLSEKAQKQKEIKLRLSYLSNDLGGISYEDAEKTLAEIGDKTATQNSDFEAAKERLEQLSKEITDITNESAAVLAELKTGFNSLEDPEKLEKKINDIKERLHEQKDFATAAQIAIDMLTLSSSQVRRGYGAELEREALEIFSRLTNGRYKGISISKSFEIKVDPADSFGTRELAYLSSGTADQAYLSMRLALIKLISSDESMPIFLDDALSQYDDKRTDEALNFLKEYAENSQIMLFTCHNSVCEQAKKNGINVISL